MTLRLNDKKAIVEEVAKVAQGAISAVVADYRGLKVSEITTLRATARNTGVYIRVVRNTLARRAVEGTQFECLNESFVGPMMIAFGMNEPSAPAKLMRDFAKTNDKLQIKALSISGRLLAANEIETLATLPNRDEGLAMLMGLMKAPIGKFVRTLAEPHAKLARTLAAIRDKKQQAA